MTTTDADSGMDGSALGTPGVIAPARQSIRCQAMSGLAALTVIRALIGTTTWLAPRLSGRLFGLDPAANPQLPYVARLFAIRDLALAVGLQSSDGDARRLWIQMGIASDAADAVAGALAGRRGELSPASAVLVTVPALVGVGLGVAALQGPEASSPEGGADGRAGHADN
jgi:hypothetical protein